MFRIFVGMVDINIIASIGVAFMLTAYLLNLADILHRDNPLFTFMNAVGGCLSAYASYRIQFWPFVVLEGTWGIVSMWAMFLFLWRIIHKLIENGRQK